jgi:rhomboid protease GluP
MNADDISASLRPRYEMAADEERHGAAIHRPWITFGILAVLLLMFLWEQWLDGPGKVAPYSLDLSTLILLGGIDRPLVLEHGQWHRLLMAPLLHADIVHLLLNSVALLLAGYLVERLLGRAWMLAVFLIGAVAGSLLSLATLSDNTVSVGASGAIMALFVAAIVGTLHLRRDARARKRIQSLAARILIPSLVPIAAGASSVHVDYGAHFGGAIAGGAVTLLLLTVWRPDERLPQYRGVAWSIVAIGGVLLAVSLFLVGRDVAAFGFGFPHLG